MAFSIISKQTVSYYRNTGRSVNDVGQYVSTYDTATQLRGSFQPVPRKLYEQYGLDFQKDYFTFYASTNILDVARNVSGDKITFNGNSYQCESANDWYAVDGWKGVLCVKTGAA